MSSSTRTGPLVTVYITNHNYGRFLTQAIESVLSQELQEYELIIVDDGSTDDSLEIMARYEALPQIQIVRQKNQGLTVSNNIAMKLSRGKYLMRLDADDYLDPRALEIMVATMEKDEDVALVFPDYYEVDENGELLAQVRRHNFDTDVTLLDQPAHGACTMIRKSVLLKVGGYDESFSRQDGYDLWLTLAHEHKVRNVNLPLFFYRQHASSLTRKERRLLETRSRILEKHVGRRGHPPLSVLAVIPVRGPGMDRRSLPLERLGDKQLVDWTIEAALGTSKVNGVVLSTPDEELLAYAAERYGNEVVRHRRSRELARINEGIDPTIRAALEAWPAHEALDAILVLNIEAPFRGSMYIEKAISVMQLYDVDSVVAVRRDDDIFYSHDGSGLKPRVAANGLRLERDDLYRKVGGMTLVKREYFMRSHRLVGGRIGHVVLDEEAAFSIRSELDWRFASYMASDRSVGTDKQKGSA